MIRVAFTGHRPPKIGGYNKDAPLRQGIRAAMHDELNKIVLATEDEVVVISGGALGVDTDAASIACFELGLRFMIAAPCLKQWAKWPKASFDAYQNMCKRADPELAIALNDTGLYRKAGVLYVHNGEYNRTCMQDRNEWMVDHTDILIAIWDGTTGGTGNCVTYANTTDVEIIYINPKEL